MSSNVSKKRPADSFIEFTTNSSSILVVFFNELAAALSASPNAPAQDALDTYLRLKPQSNLASILDERHQQRKLQMVADDILETYLDPAIYSCTPTRTFLQQILANVILEMTIQKCSRAEWINEWIVYLLEDGEPELMNVIDAGVKDAGPGQDDGTNALKGTAQSPLEPRSPKPAHNRTVSRAEEAMDEAMREAKRLTQMIQEEEEKRQREQAVSATELSDASDSTTHDVQTPTSSQSDEQPHAEAVNVTAQIPDSEKAEEDIKTPSATSIFTSFDQLGPSSVPTALAATSEFLPIAQHDSLTLYKARVSIFDDSEAVEKKTIKSKPTCDYLIQIEPASNNFPGWMIPRTYADFEVLHEVLRRISTITGIEFGNAHMTPPAWKGNTKHQLRDEMERYLNDAMRYEQLAESEGMKRFLEKSRGLTQATPAMGFWPNTSNVGKGMFDVLTKAPNQVAGGGKALFGGVTSVLGGATAAIGVNPSKRQSVPVSSPTTGTPTSGRSSMDFAAQKPEQIRGTRIAAQRGARKPLPSLDIEGNFRPSLEPRRSSSITNSRSKSRDIASPQQSNRSDPGRQQALPTDEQSPKSPGLSLPPPPDDMPDDYTSSLKIPRTQDHTSHMSADGTDFFDVPTPPTPRSPLPASPSHRGTPTSHSPLQPQLQNPRSRPNGTASDSANIKAARLEEAEAKRTVPLTDSEAQVTIEILFAVITELYTLSSAWTLRRTLLGAAKTFLLRPGNPQLESIRLLVQETLLDAHTSDAGIAAQLRKLRENCVPTEAELATWPEERTVDEKEKLRVKARELLVKRGMPQALTSVMGAAASGEALGKVFDCLQVADVARGVMFGLMLQGVRAVTQ